MSEPEATILRAPGEMATALGADLLNRLGVARIDRFLRVQRWFGGKGHQATAARFLDATPLFAGKRPSAVTRLEIELGAKNRATYQLPLVIAPSDSAGAIPAAAVLARVESAEGPGIVFDAVEDPGFLSGIGGTFASGRAFEGDRTRWVIEAIDETGRAAIPAGAPGTPGRAEQSNTSIRYGERAILKLYRRLEAGENPDAEIGEFLATRTSFRNVPRLFGTIRFEDAGGSRMVAGMLQAFVPGSRDGWAYALSLLGAGLESGAPPKDPFAAEARRLGEITRGLHEALASDVDHPDFRPEPVTPADLAAWVAQVRAQAEGALDLLARQPAESPFAEEARRCLARRGDALEQAERLAAMTRGDAGLRIRHHGDYHLGQVLRGTDGDFIVIDFEGEPARPLAERRRRHSALRDVAGMLRSFDYLAAAAARSSAAANALATTAAWSTRIRARFLEGYRSGEGSSFLPRSEEAFYGLLHLFELERFFDELAYELNNRPGWVSIPLRGIDTVLDPPEAA